MAPSHDTAYDIIVEYRPFTGNTGCGILQLQRNSTLAHVLEKAMTNYEQGSFELKGLYGVHMYLYVRWLGTKEFCQVRSDEDLKAVVGEWWRLDGGVFSLLLMMSTEDMRKWEKEWGEGASM